MSAEDLSSHVVRACDVTCAPLVCTTAFDGLTEQEALYALHLSNASWQGAAICPRQTSAESVPLLALLRLVFSEGHEPTRAAAVPIVGDEVR